MVSQQLPSLTPPFSFPYSALFFFVGNVPEEGLTLPPPLLFPFLSSIRSLTMLSSATGRAH